MKKYEMNKIYYSFQIKYAHRESNPSLILGREAFYHYTICALICIKLFFVFLFTEYSYRI